MGPMNGYLDSPSLTGGFGRYSVPFKPESFPLFELFLRDRWQKPSILLDFDDLTLCSQSV